MLSVVGFDGCCIHHDVCTPLRRAYDPINSNNDTIASQLQTNSPKSRTGLVLSITSLSLLLNQVSVECMKNCESSDGARVGLLVEEEVNR